MTALSKEVSENGVMVVSFSDSKILDEVRIQQIGLELMELPEISGGKLLLDFQGVTFMSSAMIGKILLLSKKCQSSDVVMKVCGMSDRIRDCFKITKLKMGILKDRETAVASFDKKKSWFR